MIIYFLGRASSYDFEEEEEDEASEPEEEAEPSPPPPPPIPKLKLPTLKLGAMLASKKDLTEKLKKSSKSEKSSKKSRRESSDSVDQVKVPKLSNLKLKIKLGPKPEATKKPEPEKETISAKSDIINKQRLVNSDNSDLKISKISAMEATEKLVNSQRGDAQKNREIITADMELLDSNHGGKTSNDIELAKPSPASSPKKKGSLIESLAERLYAKTGKPSANLPKVPVSNDLESIFGPSGVPLDMTNANETSNLHPGSVGINVKSLVSESPIRSAINLQLASERHSASANLKVNEAALEHKVCFFDKVLINRERHTNFKIIPILSTLLCKVKRWEDLFQNPIL